MKYPTLAASGIALAVYCVAFLVCYWPRRGRTFNFDAREEFGAFEPHAKRYQDLAKLILTLSTASIAFLVNFLVNLTPSATRSAYSVRLEAASPWVVAFLCQHRLTVIFPSS
jgi:hypothetical protein